MLNKTYEGVLRQPPPSFKGTPAKWRLSLEVQIGAGTCADCHVLHCSSTCWGLGRKKYLITGSKQHQIAREGACLCLYACCRAGKPCAWSTMLCVHPSSWGPLRTGV